MYTTIKLTAAAAAAGVLVAGCGSDEPERLSKAEFVDQVNAICAATNEQLLPIFESVWAFEEDVDPDDPANETLVFARFDAAMDEVVPIVDEELEDIRALAPPAEDEELIETLLADQEAAVAEFAGLMEAAAGGDRSAMAALEADDPFDDLNRRASAYGLTDCGRE